MHLKFFVAKLIGRVLNLIAYFNPGLSSKWALDLFSTPLKGRFKSANPIIETAKKSILQFQNMAIATYHWKGMNQTILLAHGWQSNSGRWKNLINVLKSNEYNIVCIDAPAHGASSGKKFNAVLYSKFIKVACEKYNPSILIGHSVGCMAISYFLKTSHYKKVEKLVFLGAPSAFSGILKNYNDLMGYNKRLRDGIELKIQDRFSFPSIHFNTSKFIISLECLGLIIHDEHDPVIPYSDALEIHSAFKKSHLLKTKGLGHGLKSKEVIKAITKFISD